MQKQKELHAQSKKGVRDVYATRIQSKFRGDSARRSTRERMAKIELSRDAKLQRTVDNIFRVIREQMKANRSLYGRALVDAAETFRIMDKDGSGYLDAQEFSGALHRMGLGLTEEQVADVLSLVDKDGDGEIDYDEYIALLAKGDPELAQSEDAQVPPPGQVRRPCLSCSCAEPGGCGAGAGAEAAGAEGAAPREEEGGQGEIRRRHAGTRPRPAHHEAPGTHQTPVIETRPALGSDGRLWLVLAGPDPAAGGGAGRARAEGARVHLRGVRRRRADPEPLPRPPGPEIADCDPGAVPAGAGCGRDGADVHAPVGAVAAGGGRLRGLLAHPARGLGPA